MRGRFETGRLAIVALATLVATPVATWWLVGDLSEPNGDDYVWRAPDIAPGVVALAGLLALAALAACAFALWFAYRDGRLPTTWTLSVLPLVALGVIDGFGGRVMSAATDGANIGAGLMLPVMALATVTAVVTSAVGLTAPTRRRRDP